MPNPYHLLYFKNGRRIRPVFGTNDWTSYNFPVIDGFNHFLWSFEYSGQDLEAEVWIDNLKFVPLNTEGEINSYVRYHKLESDEEEKEANLDVIDTVV